MTNQSTDVTKGFPEFIRREYGESEQSKLQLKIDKKPSCR